MTRTVENRLRTVWRWTLLAFVMLLAVAGYEAWSVSDAIRRAYFPHVPPPDVFSAGNLLSGLPLVYLLAVAATGRWRVLRSATRQDHRPGDGPGS